MKRFLLFALAMESCVSRTDLGKEPLDDTSADPQVDASQARDAHFDEEAAEAREFEKQLLGTWVGSLRIAGVKFDFALVFKDGSIYATCDWDMHSELQCSDAGFFFVTDVASNRRFAGELQNRAGQRRSKMDDMAIDTSAPPVLTFLLSNDLLASEAVLTKLP